MRTPLVAGNWKMFKGYEEGLGLASEVINIVKEEYHGPAEVALCVPFIHLASVGKLAKDSKVRVGSQNCATEKEGAFTGEVSTQQIKSCGASMVIIGHSERRQYYQENSEILVKKLTRVLEAGLTPIFCCGEPLEIRQGGDYLAFVKQQLTEGIFHLDTKSFESIVIAYEPIWAIGTGLTASAEQAQEMHKELRNHLASKFGGESAQKVRILYGGSVKASNAAELFSCADVDGGLVGGASLVSREFCNIVQAFA